MIILPQLARIFDSNRAIQALQEWADKFTRVSNDDANYFHPKAIALHTGTKIKWGKGFDKIEDVGSGTLKFTLTHPMASSDYGVTSTWQYTGASTLWVFGAATAYGRTPRDFALQCRYMTSTVEGVGGTLDPWLTVVYGESKS